MKFFDSDKEVMDISDIMEEVTMNQTYEEAIERIKAMEMNVKATARRQLEILPAKEYNILIRDTYQTIMNIIHFNEKSDVITVYQNLSKYVLGHTNTFINYHQPLKQIEMLVNSMTRIYNKYCVSEVVQ